MELKSDILHNLIDLEVENIDFLLELIHSNKNLSLSLINAFISTIELQSSSEDLEFFNKMILELQVVLDDNIALQNELLEIKEKFKSISTRLDKKVLVSALDDFKQKQERIRDIELRLYSFTPKLLNRISKNLSNIKRKELRKEIEKVIPKKPEQLSEKTPVISKEDTKQEQDVVIAEEQKEQLDSSDTPAIEQDNTETEATNTEEIIDENQTTEPTESEDASKESLVESPVQENVEENKEAEVSEGAETNVTNKIETVNTIKNDLVNESHRSSVDSLVISEITGEVILPFTHTTIDIKEFKNPVSSRFREGYNLSRERENEGVLTSISIGLKLCFKSKIHPAIIRACRDFDDLDTYLYYLDNNQVEYFPNFKILYKAYPMKNYLNKNEN